jgi:DNA-binding MurR/RpiR family transcriptional regulator
LLPEEIPAFRPEKVRDLAPAERSVIDFMRREGPSSWTLSAQALGDAAETSAVTVVRTAQKLGYEKLAHLRLALSDYYAAGPRPEERMEATLAAVPVSELLEKDVDVARDGLETLLRQVSRDDFERAVEILDRSERIVWRGIGPSGYLAQYAALHCERIGHRSVAMTQMGTALADELLTLHSKDAVVVLSYGEVQRHTEVILTQAKGSDIIVITDHDRNKLADQVTMVLECGRGQEDQFQSHAVTLVLIESLILGVADRNAPRRRRSLAKLDLLRQEITGRPIPVDSPRPSSSWTGLDKREEAVIETQAAETKGRRTRTNSGRRLNEKWHVGAKHALYHEDGTFYEQLTAFPGALFDRNGYVVFSTEMAYLGAPGLNHGVKLNVPDGISSLQGYINKKASEGL